LNNSLFSPPLPITRMTGKKAKKLATTTALIKTTQNMNYTDNIKRFIGNFLNLPDTRFSIVGIITQKTATT